MPVYLDHNATTATDPRVVEAMMPYFTNNFGNPSSVHRYGRAASTAVETARMQVAGLVGVGPEQVIFTGCGSEANNLAIQGYLKKQAPGTLIVSAIEHDCVLFPARALQEQGWNVVELAPDAAGLIDPDDVREALRANPDTRLLSIMLANNETGVIQDIPTIAAMAKEQGVTMHCDAVQAAGKIPLNFAELGVQMMTLSAHKLYGPKGMGALIFDRACDIEPLIYGGGHEQGLRAGTENLASIAGFGMAAALAQAELEQRHEHCGELQTKLEAGLKQLAEAGVPLRIFGETATRLSNTTQFAIENFEGEALLLELDRLGYAVSSGSACSSGTTEPSHVLMAMGENRDIAFGAIRVSVGKDTTDDHISGFLLALQQCIAMKAEYSGMQAKL